MADGRSKKRPGTQEQQQKIIQVSVELFLQQGTAAVSISEICKKADITRPTFYRCFESKDTLLETIYLNSVYSAVDELIVSKTDLAEVDAKSFHAIFDAVYDSIFESPELASLLFRESNDPNSPAYRIVNDAFRKVADALLPLIDLGHSNEISKVAFMSVMVANQWIVHNAINTGLSDSSKQEAKAAGWLLARQLFNLDDA